MFRHAMYARMYAPRSAGRMSAYTNRLHVNAPKGTEEDDEREDDESEWAGHAHPTASVW